MSISGSPVSGETLSGTPGVSIGSRLIYLSSITGLKVGDTIEIMLDNGEFFKTTITDIEGGSLNGILIGSPLPYRATAGNIMNDLTQTTTVAKSRAELSTDLGG